MKKETWSIIGIVVGLILTGLAILFSSLGWLNFWVIASVGITVSVISIILLLILILKKKDIIQSSEEPVSMITFEEGREMIEKDADDPKYAVRLTQDKHYTEMDLSIGEGGSTQAHYLKAKVDGEGLFYHELVDREPIKDNKGNPIKNKDGKYNYRKAIKFTIFDPDEDENTKKTIDEWIKIFATRQTRKIVTRKPIVSPLGGGVVGYEEEERELAEIEEQQERNKEEEEGHA